MSRSEAGIAALYKSITNGLKDMPPYAVDMAQASSTSSDQGFIDSILSNTNLLALIILVVVFVVIVLLCVALIILYWFFCLRQDPLFEEAKRNQLVVKRFKKDDEKEELSRRKRVRRGSKPIDYQALRGLTGGSLDAPPSAAAFIYQAAPPTDTQANTTATGANADGDGTAAATATTTTTTTTTAKAALVDDSDSQGGGAEGAKINAAVQGTAVMASPYAEALSATSSSSDDDDGAHTAHLTNAWQVAFRRFLYFDSEGAWTTRVQHTMLRLPLDWTLTDPHHHVSMEKDKDRWDSAVSRRDRLHHVLPGFFPTRLEPTVNRGRNAAFPPTSPARRPTQDAVLPMSSTAGMFPLERHPGALAPATLSRLSHNNHNSFQPAPPTAPGDPASAAYPPRSPATSTKPTPTSTGSATLRPQASSAAVFHPSPQSPGDVTQMGTNYGFWPSFASSAEGPFAQEPSHPSPQTAPAQRRLSELSPEGSPKPPQFASVLAPPPPASKAPTTTGAQGSVPPPSVFRVDPQ